MKKLTAFLAAITLIGSVANIYTPTANALNAISFKDFSEQSKEEDAEMPDLEAAHKEVTEGDFTFNVYEDFAYLTDFADREAVEVEIPAEINGVPVIGIYNSPFGRCRKLKTITFPDSLQYFDWLDLVAVIHTVSSPSVGVHTIVGSTIEEMDEETPSNSVTYANTSFNVPTVSIMSDDEENDFSAIAEIKVSETNPYFTVSDGLLYTKDMSKLIGCPPALDMAELKISEKTEIINDYAFTGCYKLKDLVIPENIKQINNGTFVACINLESVELPKSIDAVYMDTFYLCESLKTIKFNSDISAIGAGAFSECSSLTEFDIPDSVKYIGTNAFEFSPCIEVIDDIHYVDNWVVDSEEDIENVVPKKGTVGIAEMSFQFTKNIKHVDFPESVISVSDIAIVATGNYPYEIHYRASYINEDTLRGAKSASDFYIYDKECDIFDSEKTIPAEYKINEKKSDLESDGVITSVWGDIAGETVEEPEEPIDKSVVIHGYAGSTAQAYAEKYNRKFEVIEEEIPQTTTATTTTTETTTATTVETTTVTTEKPTEDVVPEFVRGDANGDGELTIADAVALQKWLLSVPNTNLTNWKAADLYDDNKLDVFDMCLMKNALLEKTNKYDSIDTFALTPTKSGVDEFMAQYSVPQSMYENDELYNITPQEITDKYGFRIFKFSNNCESFLEYNDNIYTLGTGFGGYGTTSFAVADLNNDENIEIYYTFSWGSGMHRSHIGYFDTALSKEFGFDYTCWDKDMILTVNSGRLEAYVANIKGNFVYMTATPKEKVGEIAVENRKIVFNTV